VHKEGVIKADFVKKIHEKVKLQIQQQNEKYAKYNNKRKREIIFEEGDLVWLHLRKDRFPTKRKSKLSPRGDGPFQVLKEVNNNAYKLDLPIEYGVHDAFNVIDLSPFVGTNEDKDDLDLRTNPFQGGGDDGRGPSTTQNKGHPQGRIGPTTRAMTKRLDEDWDKTTDGRETYLYMFQEAHQV